MQRSLKELKQSPVRSTQIGDQIRSCSGLLRTCLLRFKEADMVKPAQIVAGIGCRRDTSAEEIVGLIQAALDSVGLDVTALRAIATLDRKATEPGLLAAAARLGIPVRTFAAAQLAVAPTAAAPHIEALVGVHSVAEAAAQLAGHLILAKRKSAHATCALAAVGAGFDLASFGQLSTAATAASRSLTSNAGP